MTKRNYKHIENYRNTTILIYGVGRDWWWEVVVDGQSKDSGTSYFSVQSALNNARKYVDKKAV